MAATYVIGGIGMFFAFLALSQQGKGLAFGALLAVGVTGILSFIRHAIFNRSDAVHGGWDYGVTNKFQIEVGLANLAWGVFAILAVALNWGTQAIASSFLISGLYFAAVSGFILITRDIANRKFWGFIGILSWAVASLWIGIAAMSIAS
jgi:hypothetical protein